ncbi:MAG: glycosyltransferase family 2 protein [Desulfobulbus sp.]|nr:glycosyltransferase family 2 protein [Desulfobulbus sp.]
MSLNKVKLVSIAKDEAPYLSDWIFHHLYFGFSKIEIYINRTSDNSIEILDKIQKNYHNVVYHIADWVDTLPDNSRKNLQHICYMDSIKNEIQFNYATFLDIDEYWISKNFSTKITEFLDKFKNKDFESIYFEWFNEDSLEKEFSPIQKITRGKVNQLGKSIIRLPYSFNKIRLHTPIYDNPSTVLLADGSTFKSQNNENLQQHVHHSINNLKDFFILHRMHRSNIEYLSSLYKGNPELNFPIKLNRTGLGYPDNEKEIINIYFSPENYSRYIEERENFIYKNKLINSIQDAQNQVVINAKNLIKIIPFYQNKKPKAVKKVLSRTNLNINSNSNRLNNFNNSKKRIILHVGAHKTGTTSLQHFLYYNKGPLAEYNIIYAEFDKNKRINHSNLIYDAYLKREFCPENIRNTKQIEIDKNRKIIIEYLKEVEQKSKWNTLIISGENISLMSREMLSIFKNDIEKIFTIDINIEVYYCVRHPIDYMRSSLQERLKRDSLERILSNNFPIKGFYFTTIEKLKFVFKNVHIFKLEDIKNNLCFDFISKIHYQKINFSIFNKITIKNQSMCNEVAEIASFANKIRPGLFANEIYRLSNIHGNSFFSFPKEVNIDAVTVAAEKDITYLNEKFGIYYTNKPHKQKITNKWNYTITIKIIKEIEIIGGAFKEISMDYFSSKNNSSEFPFISRKIISNYIKSNNSLIYKKITAILIHATIFFKNKKY